jgi:hypothetical protein
MTRGGRALHPRPVTPHGRDRLVSGRCAAAFLRKVPINRFIHQKVSGHLLRTCHVLA